MNNNIYWCITKKGEVFIAIDICELSNFGFVAVFSDFHSALNSLNLKLLEYVEKGDEKGVEKITKIITKICMLKVKSNTESCK